MWETVRSSWETGLGIGRIKYIIRLELESWPCSGQRDQVDTDVPIVTKPAESPLPFFFHPQAAQVVESQVAAKQ